MSNIELALVTRVIDTQDFHTLDKARINQEFFSSPEARLIYEFLRETYYHPETRGLIPSREMTALRFPGFYPFVSNDSVPLLAHQLRREKVRAELMKMSQDLLMQADADPIGAIAEVRATMAKLSSLAEAGSDISLSNSEGLIRDRYEAVAAADGVIGIPYPWHVLNEETQGMQGSQFIIVYGRPKSMKTWTTIDMAVHAYATSRKRVLFYTREMSPELLMQRIVARVAKVDYKAFKNGRLQPHLKHHLFTILQEMREDEAAAQSMMGRNPFLVVVSDRSAGGSGSGGGVGWLQSKIRDYQPDIVFVDGMYLMRDDRSNQRTIDWKAIAHISQDLKLCAQEFDIPVVGVTQANRGAEKGKGDDLTELAFSDSIGQDADAVYRVTKKTVIDEGTSVKRAELYITAPGMREGTFDGIVIHGRPATSFDYIRTLTDLEEVNRADYEEKQATDASPRGRSGPPATFRRGGQGAAHDARVPLR